MSLKNIALVLSRFTLNRGTCKGLIQHKSINHVQTCASNSNNWLQYRTIHLSKCLREDDFASAFEKTEGGMNANEEDEDDGILPGGGRIKIKTIDVATSLEYMNSLSYEITYRGEHVWKPYRRNFISQFPPKYNRRSCSFGGKLRTGNPCPICRDEYLVVHYSNLKLLQQFIDPHTGELYPARKVQVCQKQYKKLKIAVTQACDKGLLEMSIPFRRYDYSDYYPQLNHPKETTESSG